MSGSPPPAVERIDPAAEPTAELAAKVHNLEQALPTRAVTGQATGILIERLKITADDAFGMLVTASKMSNRKLRDIAVDLVETGQLPGPYE